MMRFGVLRAPSHAGGGWGGLWGVCVLPWHRRTCPPEMQTGASPGGGMGLTASARGSKHGLLLVQQMRASALLILSSPCH